MPKISVLTPLYNTEPDQLKEMIESVLAQSFSDFEFLLLNDSPDNTELESLVKGFSDPRIRFFSNEENLGISESRNKLLGLASGDYIAILDHDDICYPTRLEKEAAYLDSHPDVESAAAGQMRFPVAGCSEFLKVTRILREGFSLTVQ